MRFVHLADLHIGKNLNGYSLIEDQRYALNQIIDLIEKEKIEYVVIAGDIYQSTNPSIEAVNLVDYFFDRLNELKTKVLVISGNHDSPDRLAFASTILKKSNFYISKAYNGVIEKISFDDEYARVNFYLFPYVKPIMVKRYFPDSNIQSYSDAIRIVLDNIQIDQSEINIIISHQFILNAQRSESEEIFAGEAEAVADIFYNKFDYVALGHIHKKQSFLGGKLRYPGALLKYSASEVNYDKTITIVEIKDKGSLNIIEKKINYLRDMRKLSGEFDEIVEFSKTDNSKKDYIHIELFDEDEVFEAFNKLKELYPNIMSLSYKNLQGNLDYKVDFDKIDIFSPSNLFEEFYIHRMGKELTRERKSIVETTIEKIWDSYED